MTLTGQVAVVTGGSGGGGARLTAQVEALVAAYRAIERATEAAAAPHLGILSGVERDGG